VPVAPGTSGHLVGATWRRCWWPVARADRDGGGAGHPALLFQDGGITAYGANLADMGVVGCFVGFAVAWLASRAVHGLRGLAVGAVLGAFVSTVIGATLVALWLTFSGLYPLAGILPLMISTHAAIGVLEAALTGAILATVLRWRPTWCAACRAAARRKPLEARSPRRCWAPRWWWPPSWPRWPPRFPTA